MLVLEPNKRYSITQMKKHRWMQIAIPPSLPQTIPTSSTQSNEQILRLMQSLGIDSSKTRESIRNGSYDHHAAIYFLLLDKLRNQLVGGENQKGVREVQRRRPSNLAEQAMRKIGRANTTEDCRRLLHHSITSPTASNSKISTGPRSCDSPPIHGIDAAKLLAATNSEEALKILNQAATTATAFSMSTEATRLMSTLQMSAIRLASSTESSTSSSSFKDYGSHHGQNNYSSYIHGATSSPQQLFVMMGESNKGSLGRFCTTGYKNGEITTQYSTSTDEGVETDLEEHNTSNRLSYASSSSSSGLVACTFNTSKSLSQNLSRDSNFESLEYPLSESSELASSLPSCTTNDRGPEPNLKSGVNSTHTSYTLVAPRSVPHHSKLNPLVHMSSFKATRCLTRSPVDFREGRRASDGLVAQQVTDANNGVMAFNSQKLSGSYKAKGELELHLAQREAQRLQSQFKAREPSEEKKLAFKPTKTPLVIESNVMLTKNLMASSYNIHQVSQRQKQHYQYLQPRGSKRISLPDNFSYHHSLSVAGGGNVVSGGAVTNNNVSNSEPPLQLQTAMQHRLLQQKRQILQKQCAMSLSSSSSSSPSQQQLQHSSPNASVDVVPVTASTRRQIMLRQASYKIAQQQPVLPPLPLSDSESKDLMAFQEMVENPGEATWTALPDTMQTSCQISDNQTMTAAPLLPTTAPCSQTPQVTTLPPLSPSHTWNQVLMMMKMM